MPEQRMHPIRHDGVVHVNIDTTFLCCPRKVLKAKPRSNWSWHPAFTHLLTAYYH